MATDPQNAGDARDATPARAMRAAHRPRHTHNHDRTVRGHEMKQWWSRAPPAHWTVLWSRGLEKSAKHRMSSQYDPDEKRHGKRQ